MEACIIRMLERAIGTSEAFVMKTLRDLGMQCATRKEITQTEFRKDVGDGN